MNPVHRIENGMTQAEADAARARIFGTDAGPAAPNRGLYADEEAARQGRERAARDEHQAGAGPDPAQPNPDNGAGAGEPGHNPPPPGDGGGAERPNGPEMRGRYHEAVIRLGEEMNRQAVIDAADGRARNREAGFRHQVDVLQNEINGICDVNTGEVFWDERVYRLEAVIIEVVNPRLYRDIQALQIDPVTGNPRVLDNVVDQNHLHDLQMDAHMLFLGVLQHERFAHGNEIDYLMMIHIPNGDLYHAHNEHQRPPAAEPAPAAARAAGPTPDWQRNLDAALGLDDDAAKEAAIRQWFREYGATAPGRAIHRADVILDALRRHDAAPAAAPAGVEMPVRDFNGWRAELRRALADAERAVGPVGERTFEKLMSPTGEGGLMPILVMARRQLGGEAEVLVHEAQARENLHEAFAGWFKNRKGEVRMINGEATDGIRFVAMTMENIGVLANLGTEGDPKGLGRQIGRALQLYIQLGETGLRSHGGRNEFEIGGVQRKNFFNKVTTEGELREIRGAVAAEAGSLEAERLAFRLVYVLGLAARFNCDIVGANPWGDNTAQYIYAAKKLNQTPMGPIYGRGGPRHERKYQYDAIGDAPLARDVVGLIDSNNDKEKYRVEHQSRLPWQPEETPELTEIPVVEGEPIYSLYEALRDGRFVEVDWNNLRTTDTGEMARKVSEADELWKKLINTNLADKDFNFADGNMARIFRVLGHLPPEVQSHIKTNWFFAVLMDHDYASSRVAPDNRWDPAFMKKKIDEAERAGFLTADEVYTINRRIGFSMIRPTEFIFYVGWRDQINALTFSSFQPKKR